MKISEKVYSLEATKGAYAYIIQGKETILVDTGFPLVRKRLLKELSDLNIKLTDIKHILLTHHDIDHIGNAAILEELTRAQLWASKEDIPQIMGLEPRQGFKKYLGFLARGAKPKKINPYKVGENIGGVKVIPTPGHTPGHVCLLFEDVLFAGDLVEYKNGRLIPYPAGWNWDTAALKESIKNLAAYPFKLICPAHGSPVERGGLWDMMLA